MQSFPPFIVVRVKALYWTPAAHLPPGRLKISGIPFIVQMADDIC